MYLHGVGCNATWTFHLLPGLKWGLCVLCHSSRLTVHDLGQSGCREDRGAEGGEEGGRGGGRERGEEGGRGGGREGRREGGRGRGREGGPGEGAGGRKHSWSQYIVWDWRRHVHCDLEWTSKNGQYNLCLLQFLSRHRSAETQCWMRRYVVRTYVRTYIAFRNAPAQVQQPALHAK